MSITYGLSYKKNLNSGTNLESIFLGHYMEKKSILPIHWKLLSFSRAKKESLFHLTPEQK